MNTLNPSKKPVSQDWHKADIKAAVEKAGTTLRGLARQHGVSAVYFAEALHRPLPRAQAILADLIGVAPQTLWPSRYETDGTPKRGLYHQSPVNGRDYPTRAGRMVRKSAAAGKANAGRIA
jgi:Ner family transcriptional regulator